MSFLRRMLSPSFREAVEAEAGGDYLAAAKAYARCGERHKVAEMHLLEAERRAPAEGKWRSLRDAAHFADLSTATGRELLRRVAASYLTALRHLPPEQRDVAHCLEAAALAQRAGDAAVAGEAFELAGRDSAAAEAYEAAGELEHMEAAYQREEQRHDSARAEAEGLAQAELHLRLGQRDAALEVLQRRQDVEALQRRAASLEERRLRGGAVTLQVELPGEAPFRCAFVGASSWWIGRGPECHLRLREPGVSRCHVNVRFEDSCYWVRDLDSRNGTLLGSLPIQGALPLRGEGELGIGDRCVLAFAAEGGLLRGQVQRGADRGLRLRASLEPILVSPALRLHFADGRPHLEQQASGELLLNGHRAPPHIQLIREDQVQWSEAGQVAQLKVLG